MRRHHSCSAACDANHSSANCCTHQAAYLAGSFQSANIICPNTATHCTTDATANLARANQVSDEFGSNSQSNCDAYASTNASTD